MSILKVLEKRSEGKCELCSSTNELSVHLVSPSTRSENEGAIFVCSTCKMQLEDDTSLEVNHWRCLNDSMWSEVDAVKVTAYRLLHKMSDEGWTQDLLDMIYLEEDVLEWAKEGIEDESTKIVHKDANGAILSNGDNVMLIKDLKVKGGGFTAKRGTAVRRINLVHDNAEHIEGKVEGQHIVILTQYVKKS